MDWAAVGLGRDERNKAELGRNQREGRERTADRFKHFLDNKTERRRRKKREKKEERNREEGKAKEGRI